MLRPSPADPEVAYACWVATSRGDVETGPLRLFATNDGAQSWSTLPTPVARGADCDLLPYAADPRRLLLITARGGADCPDPLVFSSTDGGADWAGVAPPRVLSGACTLSLLTSGGNLYVWAPGGASQGAGAAGGRLFASADEGTTWRAADAGLPAGALVSLARVGADGTLLALVARRVVGRGDAAEAPVRELWAGDGGSWRRLGAAPSEASEVYAGSGPEARARGTTMYAAAVPAGGDGAASALWASDVGGTAWHELPAVPAPGAGRGAPLGQGGRIVGVGPGGALLVMATGRTGDAGDATAHTLWAWDPNGLRWLDTGLGAMSGDATAAISWDARDPGASPRLVVWLDVATGTRGRFRDGLLRATLAIGEV